MSNPEFSAQSLIDAATAEKPARKGSKKAAVAEVVAPTHNDFLAGLDIGEVETDTRKVMETITVLVRVTNYGAVSPTWSSFRRADGSLGMMVSGSGALLDDHLQAPVDAKGSSSFHSFQAYVTPESAAPMRSTTQADGSTVRTRVPLLLTHDGKFLVMRDPRGQVIDDLAKALHFFAVGSILKLTGKSNPSPIKNSDGVETGTRDGIIVRQIQLMSDKLTMPEDPNHIRFAPSTSQVDRVAIITYLGLDPQKVDSGEFPF